MTVTPLKMSDLDLAVRILRNADTGTAGAFASVAKATGIPKSNIMDSFDRVEAHFGLELIRSRSSTDIRRTGDLTESGRILLARGSGLIWLYEELKRDLMSDALTRGTSTPSRSAVNFGKQHKP